MKARIIDISRRDAWYRGRINLVGQCGEARYIADIGNGWVSCIFFCDEDEGAHLFFKVRLEEVKNENDSDWL